MNLPSPAVAALAALFLLCPAAAPWAAENTAVPATTPTSDFVLDDEKGTAYHKKTGLTWKRCAEGWTWNGSTCIDPVDPSTFTWFQALSRASGDWRLPNLKELNSIVEQRNWDPAINGAVFPATPVAFFWSASPYAPDAGNAWDVDFGDGFGNASFQGNGNAVRLVRGGQYALLSVTKAGTGSGTVTSNQPGIDCGLFCQGSFADAMFTTAAGPGAIMLTATPNPGSTFAGWTDCPAVVGNQCSFFTAANTTVTGDLHARAAHRAGRRVA